MLGEEAPLEDDDPDAAFATVETPVAESVAHAERLAGDAHHITNRLQFLAKVQEVARRDFALCCQTFGPQVVTSSLLHPPAPLWAGGAPLPPRWPALGAGPPGRLVGAEAPTDPGAGRLAGPFARPTASFAQKVRRGRFLLPPEPPPPVAPRPPPPVPGTADPAAWRHEPPQREAPPRLAAARPEPPPARGGRGVAQREGRGRGSPQCLDGIQQMHALLREQVHSLTRLETLVAEKLTSPNTSLPHASVHPSPDSPEPPHPHPQPGPIRSITDIPLADRQRVMALLTQNTTHSGPAGMSATSTRLALARQTQTVMDGTTQTTRSLEQSVYSTHTVSFLSSASTSAQPATSQLSPSTPLLAELEEREEELRRLHSPPPPPPPAPPEPEHLEGLRRIHAQIQDLLARSDRPPEPQPISLAAAIAPAGEPPPPLPERPAAAAAGRRSPSPSRRSPSAGPLPLPTPGPPPGPTPALPPPAAGALPVGNIDAMLATVSSLETETAAVAARAVDRRRRLQAAVDFQGLLGPPTTPTPAATVVQSTAGANSALPDRLRPGPDSAPPATFRPTPPPPPSSRPPLPPPAPTYPSWPDSAAAPTPALPNAPSRRPAQARPPPPPPAALPGGRRFHERRGVALGDVDAATRRRLEGDRERFVRYVATGEAAWNSSHLTQYDFAERMTEEVVGWLVRDSATELAQLLDGFLDHIVLQEVGLTAPPPPP